MKQEEQQTAPPENMEETGKKSRRIGLVIALVVCVLALLVGDGYLFLQIKKLSRSENASVRIEELERRISALEEERAAPVPAVSADNAAVGEALRELEAKVRDISQTAQVAQVQASSGLAVAVAFFQMQMAALSGEPFEKQRLVLRETVGPDPAFAAPLTGLGLLATQGVSPPSVLYALWRAHSAKVRATLLQAEAKTWQDRVLAALEGLVSVRSLNAHGEGGSVLDAIENDLSHARVAMALEKIANLPPQAQDVLKAWTAQAKARMELESLSNSLAALLIARDQKDQAKPETQERTP